MYKNSIIVAHRNRPNCLKTFLRSMELAALQVSPDSYEVVISDLGSKRRSLAVMECFSDSLNLKVIKNQYKGSFWKTKSLNNAASHTKGKYITMLDVDSVVNCNFLENIRQFYSIDNNKGVKLAHRVRFLTPAISKVLLKSWRKFDCDFLRKHIVKRASLFNLARERYSSQEIRYVKLPKEKRAKMQASQALGNSHFTMLKDDYMALGGNDERFIGHGLEDLDFNLRAWRLLKCGRLFPDHNRTVYHVAYAVKGTDWIGEKFKINNRRLYRKNKAKHIIKVPMSKNWGKF
jgi:predicted glycosyltransferase involved in capsule biosynthesis